MADEPPGPNTDAQAVKNAAEAVRPRGELHIYLGAAPGVGKTYAMLQEARRRKQQGTDVVVGFVETYGRQHTTRQLDELETVPPREAPYRGALIHEMDTEAVIARRPEIALVDELAHTNVPGSRHEKRYEDVRDMLAVGISVLSTLNVQHVESLNDTVKQLTGVTVHETVPDWVLDESEQIELIDMTPEALIQRLQRGNIYPPEQARQALGNFFTPGNLTALRNLALHVTARAVEGQLTRLMRDQAGRADVPLVVIDRIVVAVDHRQIGTKLIRRGWRMAATFKADLSVVYVEPERGARAAQSLTDERRLRTNLQLADELGAQVVRLRGHVVDELVAFARARKATLLVIGQSTRSRRDELLHGSITHDLLRKAQGFDVLMVADQTSRREKDDHAPA